MADNNWSRIVNTTIAQYIRGEEVNVIRNRKLLAMLKERGRITFNHSGTLLDWKVRYRRAPITGYADGDTLTFARRDRHKTAQLPWRGYSATDAVTKMERLQNKNTEAIINVFSTTAQMLMDDIEDQFGDEFYIDGNGSGNTKRMHGLESFLGAGSTQANGYVIAPNSTYAGLNCSLGYYGGAWSTVSSNVNWPAGTGDAHYDFWSPLLIAYANSAWGATTDNWSNNAIEVMRFAVTHAGRNKSKRGQLDLILLEPELYRQFLQANESKQQIFVRRGDKPGGLVALGFSDVFNFDGVEVTREYGVPSGAGYGITVDAMELKSLQGQLFAPEGPDLEISTKSYRFSIDFFGNLQCNPRNFVKFVNQT
jgi:hypothetical protein